MTCCFVWEAEGTAKRAASSLTDGHAIKIETAHDLEVRANMRGKSQLLLTANRFTQQDVESCEEFGLDVRDAQFGTRHVASPQFAFATSSSSAISWRRSLTFVDHAPTRATHCSPGVSAAG